MRFHSISKMQSSVPAILTLVVTMVSASNSPAEAPEADVGLSNPDVVELADDVPSSLSSATPEGGRLSGPRAATVLISAIVAVLIFLFFVVLRRQTPTPQPDQPTVPEDEKPKEEQPEEEVSLVWAHASCTDQTRGTSLTVNE